MQIPLKGSTIFVATPGLTVFLLKVRKGEGGGVSAKQQPLSPLIYLTQGISHQLITNLPLIIEHFYFPFFLINILSHRTTALTVRTPLPQSKTSDCAVVLCSKHIEKKSKQ